MMTGSGVLDSIYSVVIADGVSNLPPLDQYMQDGCAKSTTWH